MTLKTATLIAIIGIMIPFVYHVVFHLIKFSRAGLLPLIIYSLFYIGLLIFFVTLYRKQKNDG